MKPAPKMLYMLMLTGSHDAAVPVRRTNPFNGEPVDVYPPALTDAENAEAEPLLARHGARCEGRRHVLQLGDGTAVEVVAGVDDGEPGRWSVSFGAYLQHLSRDAMRFLFELCDAGSFILEGADVGVVTRAAVMDQHCDDGFVLVRSPEALEILMKEGRSAYAKHVGSS